MTNLITSACTFGEQNPVPMAIAAGGFAALQRLCPQKLAPVLKSAAFITAGLAVWGTMKSLLTNLPSTLNPPETLSKPTQFYNGYCKAKKTTGIASQALLPSQTTDTQAAIQHIPLCTQFTLGTKDGGLLNGVVIPPTQPLNTRHCIFYSNPNAQTTGEHFDPSGVLYPPTLPAVCAKALQCPLVMYDYRGTGMSNTNPYFSATPETLVEDGTLILESLTKQYDHIYVVGTSLGGAVATASLANVLAKSPALKSKFHLINHDSFSSTHKIFRLFGSQTLSEWIAKSQNVFFDVREAMKKVLAQKVPVLVINHTKDPVIPELAQMSTFILDKCKNPPSVTLFQSPEKAHATMPPNIGQTLRAFLA